MLFRLCYCSFNHLYSAEDHLKGFEKYPLEISELDDSMIPRPNILLN